MAPVTDQPGYWGERTATIDWCEKNYVESYYVAEMCKFTFIILFSYFLFVE